MAFLLFLVAVPMQMSGYLQKFVTKLLVGFEHLFSTFSRFHTTSATNNIFIIICKRSSGVVAFLINCQEKCNRKQICSECVLGRTKIGTTNKILLSILYSIVRYYKTVIKILLKVQNYRFVVSKMAFKALQNVE